MSRKKISDTEKNYSAIGHRFEVLQKTLGINATKICKRLNISIGYLSDLKRGRGKGGGIKLWDAIHREFPEWEAFLRGKVENPPSPDTYNLETSDQYPPKEKGDRVPGSYGTIDFSSHQIMLLIEGKEIEISKENIGYVHKVAKILTSGELDTVVALQNNINQFHDQIHEKAEIRKLKAEQKEMKSRSDQMEATIKKLDKEVKRLKNTTSGCAEDMEQPLLAEGE